MKNGETEGSGPMRPNDGASGDQRPHKTPQCPDEERIRNLVPGLVGPDEAEELLAHASGCVWCGTVLREATRDLGDPATEEEERIVRQSKFAQPRHRRRLAKQLVYHSREVGAQRRFSVRWAIPTAATLVVIALVAVPGYQQWARGVAHTSVLLGRAYSLHRQMDARLPGAEYGLRHVEMGGVASRFNSPVALSDAILNIQRAIQAHPDDPQWLQLEGRADLLDNQEESAITKLERARALRPGDSDILADLGAAQLLKAEKNGDDPKGYSTAFDVLAEGLRHKPDDPVLVFNLALAAEHIYALNEAQAAWSRYLKLDSGSQWAAEARHHIEVLKKSRQAARIRNAHSPRRTHRGIVA